LKLEGNLDILKMYLLIENDADSFGIQNIELEVKKITKYVSRSKCQKLQITLSVIVSDILSIFGQ